MRAHLDHGKLRAARSFEHVQVAIGIARVEGLHRRGNQKVALAGVADSLPFCGMTGAVNLVHGMRHVIAQA